jgi:hypothetical protein
LIVVIRGFAEGVVFGRDGVAEPVAVFLTGGHVGDVGTVESVVACVWTYCALAASGLITFVLEAIDRISEVSDVVVVGERTCPVEVGVDPRAGLVVLAFATLDAVVFGVGAK